MWMNPSHSAGRFRSIVPESARRKGAVLVVSAIVILAASTAASNQDNTDLVVLHSDERSLVVEFRPRYSPLINMSDEGQAYTLVDFAGSVPTYTAETVGQPDLRFRILPAGFPSIEGNAVQVIAADYEDIPGVLLAPVPHFFHDGEGFTDEVRLIPDGGAYRAGGFLPETIARLEGIGKNRSMILGSVLVHPVQYNAATRTVRKYSRIVVEVIFGSPQGYRVQNDDDEMFRELILNHDVARAWKFGIPASLRKGVSSSVLATGDWYRLTIQDDGIYRLDASWLAAAGINLNGVDPRTIKIYGSDGRVLPENHVAPRPTDLVENAILVVGEEDGRFDAGDYVLFYGKSVRGWNYDAVAKTLRHYLNHYTEVNYYWLTFGGPTGKRMQVQQSLTNAPEFIPDRFTDGIAVEQELFNLLGSGKDWLGPSMGPGGSFTVMNTLHGLITDDIVRYRYTLVARADKPPSFTVRESGNTVGNHFLSTVAYNSDFAYASAGTFSTSINASQLSSNTSQLNFSFSSASAGATGWLDWVEVHYPRRFQAANNSLRFWSPDTTGVVEYRLEQFSSAPVIWNVGNPSNVRVITGVVGTYAFRAAELSGGVNEYVAASANAFKTPLAVQRISNQNLRGYVDGAEFIIVTHQRYMTAAQRLKAYREQPAGGSHRTVIVDVDQIYNEFAHGLPDISAIRDYLKHAYENWLETPRYVLLFGAASYDYKDLLGTRSSYVPTWQSVDSRDGVGSYSTDDFFARFGTSASPTLVGGRIPARTPAEANIVVDKIIGYEQQSATGTWKLRMLFVGDDQFPHESEGALHTQQMETLAEGTVNGRRYTPEMFERRKVYIAEYATVVTAQGRRKPGAYQALIDHINEGVLAVNFAGHGNPTVWMHEGVFSVQTSIPALTNSNKLALFFLATCNFSQYDDAKRYTGSELLLYKPDGGAIGVISATRKVFAHQNAALQQRIYQGFFIVDQFGRIQAERPAVAVFTAKAFFNSSNDQKFFFMGDPTLRVQFPLRHASIDAINQNRIDTLSGSPGYAVQLRALSRANVEGTIRGGDNSVDSTFTGRVTLQVNDVNRSILIPNFYNFSYLAPGGLIYRGENSINSGRFTSAFVVPKDISYADTSARGRIVAYFQGNGTEGAGYTGAVNISGTDPNAPIDTDGPEIAMYLDSRGFRAGDLVSEDPRLLVDLVDSSGINTSTAGIGHRIEAWVNNSPQSIDLTEFYSGRLDSYQEGTVQYQLKGLPQGRNYVRLRAWDTYNNPSVAETFFEVTSSSQLTISDVFNYPNPFSGQTMFTFRQNQLTPLDITIRVYTLAGRLIQTLEAYSPGEPMVRVDWDGRDRDGDVLANGVYLYKVVVKTTDGRFSSEALGKLSVLK
jgi:hypothetical protein